MKRTRINAPLSSMAKKASKFVATMNFAFVFTFLTVFTACDKDRKAEEAPACTEKVKADCVTTFEYNPVCGCNNVTYSNPGAAVCSGITDYKSGECPK